MQMPSTPESEKFREGFASLRKEVLELADQADWLEGVESAYYKFGDFAALMRERYPQTYDQVATYHILAGSTGYEAIRDDYPEPNSALSFLQKMKGELQAKVNKRDTES